MSNVIESISEGFTSMCSKLKNNVPVVVGVYFAIVLAHFVCSNIYPTLCCKMSVWGFIMSPFMAVTPHCEALRWIIHYTGEQIRNVWLWLGGYLIWYFGNNITPFILNFSKNVSPNKQDEEIEEVNEGITKRKTRSCD